MKYTIEFTPLIRGPKTRREVTYNEVVEFVHGKGMCNNDATAEYFYRRGFKVTPLPPNVDARFAPKSDEDVKLKPKSSKVK